MDIGLILGIAIVLVACGVVLYLAFFKTGEEPSKLVEKFPEWQAATGEETPAVHDMVHGHDQDDADEIAKHAGDAARSALEARAHADEAAAEKNLTKERRARIHRHGTDAADAASKAAHVAKHGGKKGKK